MAVHGYRLVQHASMLILINIRLLGTAIPVNYEQRSLCWLECDHRRVEKDERERKIKSSEENRYEEMAFTNSQVELV